MKTQIFQLFINVHHNLPPTKVTIIYTSNFILGMFMECIKCHSHRITRFLDGFGERRIFCKSCQESFLIDKVNGLKDIRKVSEFAYHNVYLLKDGASH